MCDQIVSPSMKKILFLLLLLTGAYPLYITAQSNYDHKLIAVLPVRAKFPEYKKLSDSSAGAFRSLEIKYGMQLQEELYRTITRDTNRLLVEVQPWQITDSILKNMGLDLRKVSFLDMSAIAKILRVDACVVVTVGYGTRSNIRSSAGSNSIAGFAGGLGASELTRAIYRNNKIFTFRLVDGKSGDEVWNYSQEMTAGDITLDKDQLIFSRRLFKGFMKRFPYCD